MKGQVSLLIIALIIVGTIIALAVAQGQQNTINIVNQSNITNSLNITNDLGVTIPIAENTTGQLNFSRIDNFTGISGIPQANLSGITLPASNVTSDAFGTGNYSFDSMITIPYINITTLICLNSGCNATILFNGTHIIINNSA